MQLQAFLDSLRDNAPGFCDNIDVLYRSDGYDKGYDIVKERHPNVKFHRETNFKNDLLSLFKYEFTLFAADDDIVYGKFGKEVLSMVGQNACFSLRLGLNIDYCYSNDKANNLKEYVDLGDCIWWDWRKEELDFGYPLSVVSHVFKTEKIKELSEPLEFLNPNTYEGVLQKQLGKIDGHMIAFKQSKIFGVPANRVNDCTNNRNGLLYPHTIDDLYREYLSGKTIDVTKIPSIHAAQQEIDYELVG